MYLFKVVKFKKSQNYYQKIVLVDNSQKERGVRDCRGTCLQGAWQCLIVDLDGGNRGVL